MKWKSNESFSGNAELQSETLFQVFWFICNISAVALLNFIVNLHLSQTKFWLVSSFYDFLKLDDVEIIKNTLAFNAIIGTIFISGSIATVLYFLQIRKCLKQIVPPNQNLDNPIEARNMEHNEVNFVHINSDRKSAVPFCHSIINHLPNKSPEGEGLGL